ncbi:hypothetical protein IWW43_004470 [Coemansia sp. RSA 1935]|nr:hypothetical protein IWW43_004470 [Coemansia sp. RSA 1935]
MPMSSDLAVAEDLVDLVYWVDGAVDGRSVASIKELDEFVHNASAQTFQEAFTVAKPDMGLTDALLMSNLMFLDFTAASS